MTDCIFCKIAGGSVSSGTLYEDDEFRVILDLAPASRGHALILPKAHYEDICEIPEVTLQKAMCVAKKMAVALKEALGCDGLNVLQNNGTAAGQTVFHYHIHLIPRYENDGVGIKWIPGELTDESAQEIIRSVKEKIVF